MAEAPVANNTKITVGVAAVVTVFFCTTIVSVALWVVSSISAIKDDAASRYVSKEVAMEQAKTLAKEADLLRTRIDALEVSFKEMRLEFRDEFRYIKERLPK